MERFPLPQIGITEYARDPSLIFDSLEVRRSH
jgi:hypothetical protein